MEGRGVEGRERPLARGGHFGIQLQASLSFLPILSIPILLDLVSVTFCLDPCHRIFLADLASLPLPFIWHLERAFKNAEQTMSLSASVFPTRLSVKICQSPTCEGCLSGSCCPSSPFLACCPASGPLHLLFLLLVILFPCLHSSD